MLDWSVSHQNLSRGPSPKAISRARSSCRPFSLGFFLPQSESQGQAYRFPPMAPPPGPYSGTSTLALVARVSAFSAGLVYGSLKLKYLQAKAKFQKKAEAKAKAHH